MNVFVQYVNLFHNTTEHQTCDLYESCINGRSPREVNAIAQHNFVDVNRSH